MIDLRLLNKDDLPKMISVRDSVVGKIPKPSLFVPPGDEYIVELLNGNDISIGAFYGEKLLGFISLCKPPRKENLGCVINLDEKELNSVWHLEHSLVLEEHRRKKIFSKLFSFGKNILKDEMKLCFKTIAPENTPSLAAAFDNDFEIVARIEAYGGLDRFVLMHHSPNSCKPSKMFDLPATPKQYRL